MTILPTPDEIKARAAVAKQRDRTRREHGYYPTIPNREPIEPKDPVEVERRYRMYLALQEIRNRMGYPQHNAHLREERQFAPGYPPLQLGGFEDAKGRVGLWLDGGRVAEVIHWDSTDNATRWHTFGQDLVIAGS